MCLSVSLCLSVCLSVCLSACISQKRDVQSSKLYRNFVHVAYGRGSVLLQPRCDTLCTSGFFADGAMFARNRSGDASKASTRMTHQGQHWRDTGRSDCFCLYIRQQLVTPYRTRDIPSLAWGHCGALGHVPPPLYFQRFILFFYHTSSEL